MKFHGKMFSMPYCANKGKLENHFLQPNTAYEKNKETCTISRHRV